MVYVNMNQKMTHLNYLKKKKKIVFMNANREMTQFKIENENFIERNKRDSNFDPVVTLENKI